MFAASKTASVSGGYQISRSLRFNSADSAYLNRTPASAGSRTTWTWSAWVKRGLLGEFGLLSGGASSTTDGYVSFYFTSTDTLSVQVRDAGANKFKTTTQVFRDPSAWYHIVLQVDTTQATASSRVRLYINGSQVTVFSADDSITQNLNTNVNNTVSQQIGAGRTSGGSLQQYYDGYMTEVNFIDGQALTPSSFGETNAQTGVWQPKAYSGSYGTNGFYLNFSDNSNTTAATLGKDYSGNGNNWTPNNFSVTAGAGNDSMVDTPTSYGTDTGVGGTVRGNYCTWNPLKNPQVAVLTNGNLDLSTAGSTARYGTYTTIGVSNGQWYWEITAGSLSTDGYNIGIVNASKPDTTALNADTNSYIYLDTGAKGYNGTGTAYGATYTAGDVIGVALDLDAGTLVFYKNGTSQGTAFTSIASNTWFPTVADNATGSTTGSSFIANFGQRPFAYTAPSGYKALCTQNLPTPTIGATTATQAGKFFNPVLYTADGAGGATVTGVGFQPDWTWWKARSNTDSHIFADVLRGSTAYISSNNTNAEATRANLWVTSSDGWSSSAGTMSANQTYVAWNWKANGSGSTNTSGSITSTVSANTTSGFSVVTYTGNNTTSATFGHGLGVTPSFAIIKRRDSTGDWFTGMVVGTNVQRALLNSTAAASAGSPVASFFTSTTVQPWYFDATGSGLTNVNSATYVAYCFAEVAGYSKFGSYTGNGSADGPFCYTGFRPAYVMIKSSSNASNWTLLDNKRNTYNVVNQYLDAETSAAEGTFTFLDFTSNGFKIRTSDTSVNGGDPRYYIYMAFAENPFKYSLAR